MESSGRLFLRYSGNFWNVAFKIDYFIKIVVRFIISSNTVVNIARVR